MADNKGLIIHPGNEKPAEGPAGTNHLLVIAIDDYLHAPKLINCVKDAEAFAGLLWEKYLFEKANTTFLRNSEATRPKILDTIRDLRHEVRPQDNLVIYFSGHGETLDGTGYWVPVEAVPGSDAGYVSSQDLKSRLDTINNFHTLLIADACFSGALFLSYRNMHDPGGEDKPSRWGLAASHNRERAMDGTPGGNSPFAQRLLWNLRHSRESLGILKLAAALTAEVAAATDGRQTPVCRPLDVKGDDFGQFVFRLRTSDEPSQWAAACKAATAGAMKDFLALFPKGRFAGEAGVKLRALEENEAWGQASTSGSIDQLLDFLDHFPGSSRKTAARKLIEQLEDAQDWETACNGDRIGDYLRYKEKHPQGKRFKEAGQQIRRLRRHVSTADPPEPAEPPPLPPAAVVGKTGSQASPGLGSSLPAALSPALFAAAAVVLLLTGILLSLKRDRPAGRPARSSAAGGASPGLDTACYEALFQRGLEAAVKKNYAEAIGHWEAADNCADKPARNELPGLIGSAKAELQRAFSDSPGKGLAGKGAAGKKGAKDPAPRGGNAKPQAGAAPSPLGMEMVLVKGGAFTMGCTGNLGDCPGDETACQVVVPDFYIGKHEVTQKQWREVMGSDPPGLKFKGCDDCPVESISWDDVQRFLRLLREKTGVACRLPTEAEWEYAARGGKKSQGHQYAGGEALDEVAWYTRNSRQRTRPVGRKKPNELGLHDMSGNVWEWCSDWYGQYGAGPKVNPKGPESGPGRVIRGGSYFNHPHDCRVAGRSQGKPADAYVVVGFRLARAP